MAPIETMLKSWTGEKRMLGDLVYQRVVKRLDHVLDNCYRSIGVKEISPDIRAIEHQKFRQIAIGDFAPEYFVRQRKITQEIAAKVELLDYVLGYANYAAGLVNAALNRSSLIASRQNEIIESIMSSIFSDLAVVIYHYFDEL